MINKTVRFQIDDEFIESLMKDVGYKKGNQICREALTLLKWCVKELKNDRFVVSCDRGGDNLKEPTNDFLTAIAMRIAK